jgi:hypothetical protein
MEEERKQVDDTDREPRPPVKKHNCHINIFCDEEKHDGEPGDGKEHCGNCHINIFCHEMKHDDMWDGDKEHDGGCRINIFCHAKKQDGKCDDSCW